MREYAARRRAEGRPLPKSQWRAYEERTCDCCGAVFTREKRKERYAQAFCSLLCRDYTRSGRRVCKIPRSHMINIIGKTCRWPRSRTSERVYRDRECDWCSKQYTTHRDNHAYCSRPCKEKAARILRRARAAGATGTFRWGDVVKLWAAFGKACAYCRQPLELQDMQAEHVIALARGGANNIGNILPSCAPCNSDKRELSMDEWRADRERRGLPPVITRWEWSDPRYKHLAGDAMCLAA